MNLEFISSRLETFFELAWGAMRVSLCLAAGIRTKKAVNQRRRYDSAMNSTSCFRIHSLARFLSHFRKNKKRKKAVERREEKSIKITTTAQKSEHCCTLQQYFAKKRRQKSARVA